MKKKIAALLVALGISVAAISPANAWYRYGGYYGGYYGGGYGAALGVAAGAALLGGVIGGAIAAQPYGYGYGYAPYYAVPAVPVYRYNAPVYYYDYYGW